MKIKIEQGSLHSLHHEVWSVDTADLKASQARGLEKLGNKFLQTPNQWEMDHEYYGHTWLTVDGRQDLYITHGMTGPAKSLVDGIKALARTARSIPARSEGLS